MLLLRAPGHLDVQRVLYNFHRRNFPLEVLHEKARKYIDARLIDEASAFAMIRAIEAERGTAALINDYLDEPEASSDPPTNELPLARLSVEELRELLRERERQMQDSGGPNQSFAGPSDVDGHATTP